MRKILSFIFVLSLYSISYGAYLRDVPYELIQPNGEVLSVYITGDEFFRRVHDSNGYSIVEREDGWYCYAIYDAENDELIASEYVVSSDQQALLPMEKGLGISYEKYMEIRRSYFEPTGCDPSGAANKSVLEDLANIKTSQQMNNIIICIGFSDTQGMTNNFSYVDGMYNSNTNNNMRDYYDAMSYGKIDLVSKFYPPADGNVLRFYKDNYPRNYYRPYSASNTEGYSNDNQATSREHSLLRNAINWVNANWPIPTDLNLDINNDGKCDFITFIIYGAVDGWSDLLWPHKWNLYSTPYAYINGKRVDAYNFELDGTSTYFNVGTFCHEGFHVLGAPDLYHYNSYTNLQTVGSWDVMENTSNSKPQSMSAYMKLRYGRWIYNNEYTHINFPAAVINQTYEVFPFYTNDGSDPKKPIMYRIPMTGITTQYSIVEYRKRTGMNYDAASIPGEGLLIYRINTSFSGNAEFNGTSVFDEVYLYRNGSSQTDGVYSNGNLSQAPYNASNGKTAFNSTTNPKPCRSNGTSEAEQNINNILYDSVTDSYTFFYGNPSNRTISLNKTELELDKLSGSSGTVNVSSNVLWHVSIPSSASGWLSASITKGLNNGTVIFTTLSDNNTGAIRSVNVTFTGNDKSFTVAVVQNFSQCAPPTNLIINYNSNCDAELTWTAPSKEIIENIDSKPIEISNINNLSENIVNQQILSHCVAEADISCSDNNIDRNDTWLTWITNFTNVTGVNGYTLGFFQRFATSDLTNYAGHYITKIKYHPTNHPDGATVFSANPRIQVYVGGTYNGTSFTGGTMVADIVDANYVLNVDNIINLPTDILITGTQEIWFGVIFSMVSGYPVATIASGATGYISGKTDLMLYDNSWTTSYNLFQGNPQYGWYMAAFASESSSQNLYNIYRDGNIIASNIASTSYTDTGFDPSLQHIWSVKTVCGSSESNPISENKPVCNSSYTIEVSANPPVGGSVSGGGTVNHGASVTVTASANSGYNFVNWTESGNQVSTNASYQFTASANRALVANFALKTYTIEVSANPPAGGSVSGGGTVNHDVSVTVTASANTGYNFVNWTENGNPVSTNATYQFSAKNNRILIANFSLKTYTIEVSANPTEGGNLSGGGTVYHNANVTVTASANAGYNFLNWTESGNPVSTNASYQFTAENNRVLVANFTLKTYTIEVSANPTDGGNVSGGGNYPLGQSVTVTASANSGYNFVNWTESGNPISTNASYQFTANSNRTLVANFALNQYTIEVSANPTEGGYVSGGGTFSLGESVTVTASANTGYHFVNWTENDVQVSENISYQFTANSNRTLVANFEINKYTIEVSINPPEACNFSGGGIYEHGTVLTINFLVNEGYTFINWTENDIEVCTKPTYTFTVERDINLVVNFIRNSYNIEISANPPSGGKVFGDGNFNHGESVTVIASVNDNYIFINWTENELEVSKETSYQFFAEKNRILVANFVDNSEINKNNLVGFTIHPNPVNDMLKVVRFSTEKAQLEVFTSDGLSVITQHIDLNETVTIIDVSLLSTGVYIIRLTDEVGSSTQRFLKK